MFTNISQYSPLAYQLNKPYPHIVMDNFLPKDILEEVLEEWPPSFMFSYKSCGTSIKNHLSDYDSFGDSTKKVFKFLNSQDFLRDLEVLTGIRPLIADEGLEGGGLHDIPKGGFLKLHADFNYHFKKSLNRKLNLLIYLNKDWEKEWGGALEIIGPHDTMDTHKIIYPKFNRAVLFTTTSDSWHGHPYPLECPKGVSRKSLALYYYCDEEPPEVTHSTLYRPDLENITFANTEEIL